MLAVPSNPPGALHLGAPTSPAHPKELPALMGALGFGSVLSIVVVVAVSQAKIRRGVGVLAVGVIALPIVISFSLLWLFK